jgi:hypothetical protein
VTIATVVQNGMFKLLATKFLFILFRGFNQENTIVDHNVVIYLSFINNIDFVKFHIDIVIIFPYHYCSSILSMSYILK